MSMTKGDSELAEVWLREEGDSSRGYSRRDWSGEELKIGCLWCFICLASIYSSYFFICHLSQPATSCFQGNAWGCWCRRCTRRARRGSGCHAGSHQVETVHRFPCVLPLSAVAVWYRVTFLPWPDCTSLGVKPGAGHCWLKPVSRAWRGFERAGLCLRWNWKRDEVVLLICCRI